MVSLRVRIRDGHIKSRPHTTAYSGRRLHAMMHASRSLCLKHIFHYFISFVFNRLLHDILSPVHIFVFTLLKFQ